jgi:hypothetical protein
MPNVEFVTFPEDSISTNQEAAVFAAVEVTLTRLAPASRTPSHVIATHPTVEAPIHPVASTTIIAVVPAAPVSRVRQDFVAVLTLMVRAC